jgi:DNA repair exonuclease SbcCD ATPase subunit
VDRIAILEPPGSYTVTLTVGSEKSSQKLTVLKDPHSTGSESDIEKQLQVVSALQEEMNALAGSVNQIESIRAQLADLEKQLGRDDAAKEIQKAATELAKKLTEAEGKVVQLKATGRGQDDVRYNPMLLQKVSYLADEVESSSDFPPTTQQAAVQLELKKQGDDSQQEMQQVIAKDVAAFNAMLREKNVANIIVKAP